MTEQLESRSGLLAHRAWLEGTRVTISRDRDKMVLAVAGGTLGVSLTFLNKIATVPGSWSTLLLVAGWGLEVAAIVLILRSLHCSEAALEHERERIDSMLGGDGKDPGWANVNAKKTESLNSRASILAVAGIVAILAYAVVSLIARPNDTARVVDRSPSQEVGGRP